MFEIKDGVLLKYHGAAGEKRAVIPPGVRTVGGNAFYGSEHIEEIEIPDGVTRIGYFAFANCKALRTVIMPDSVTELGAAVLTNCPSLTEVKLSENITQLNTTFNNCDSLETVTVPSKTEVIKKAFRLCPALQRVVLPEGLRELDDTFDGCRSLRELRLPDSVRDFSGIAVTKSGLERVTFRGYDIVFGSEYEERRFISIHWFSRLLEFAENDTFPTSPPYSCGEIIRRTFILARFVKDRTPKQCNYIKYDYAKVMKHAISLNETDVIAAMAEEGLLNSRSISRYIKLAAELGREEIYLMLVRYKDEAGGYGGSGRFRL